MAHSRVRDAIGQEVRAAADVLRRDWDPIGGGKIPDLPEDEYEAYAQRAVAMLHRGATDAGIATYLGTVEADVIGMASGVDLVIIARKLRVAVAASHHRAT